MTKLRIPICSSRKSLSTRQVDKTFQSLFRENPDMLRPRVKPLSARFSIKAAVERYMSMKIRKFVIPHCLPELVDVRDVTGAAKLIYTLISADHSLQP
ncbi:hypothetical protein F2Q69_00034761 [Brassica cretica]|uniref:Uncharacterized protein n=1 Tax=Brassica cretica TaxID=69181 RepID=A0A8S9SFT7_BRACR|nr:hypothetical protein F2Q69_00034761 [Brassica cretica]